ncbi:hypothetical protein B0H13DRAFT_2570984 [Mycena leptocephala]|nr:hypothetical protein B0H13DRAFT_2570984 [Mycena leptocephala]
MVRINPIALLEMLEPCPAFFRTHVPNVFCIHTQLYQSEVIFSSPLENLCLTDFSLCAPTMLEAIPFWRLEIGLASLFYPMPLTLECAHTLLSSVAHLCLGSDMHDILGELSALFAALAALPCLIHLSSSAFDYYEIIESVLSHCERREVLVSLYFQLDFARCVQLVVQSGSHCSGTTDAKAQVMRGSQNSQFIPSPGLRQVLAHMDMILEYIGILLYCALTNNDRTILTLTRPQLRYLSALIVPPLRSPPATRRSDDNTISDIILIPTRNCQVEICIHHTFDK